MDERGENWKSKGKGKGKGKGTGEGKGKEKAARHGWKGEPTILLIKWLGQGRPFTHYQQWRGDAGGSKKKITLNKQGSEYLAEHGYPGREAEVVGRRVSTPSTSRLTYDRSPTSKVLSTLPSTSRSRPASASSRLAMTRRRTLTRGRSAAKSA